METMKALYTHNDTDDLSICPGTMDSLIIEKLRDGCSIDEIAGALVFFGLSDLSHAEKMVIDNILN